MRVGDFGCVDYGAKAMRARIIVETTIDFIFHNRPANVLPDPPPNRIWETWAVLRND
jgi:hypothetical protein